MLTARAPSFFTCKTCLRHTPNGWSQMPLHAGGAPHMASGDRACLGVRPLRPAWLLAAMPGLQDHLPIAARDASGEPDWQGPEQQLYLCSGAI